MEDIYLALKDRFNQINATPWTPVQKLSGLLTFGFFAVVCYYGNTGQRWVPLIDPANLMFHEAGHPIVGLFSNQLAVYGGTWGQLFFPIVCSIHFWVKRQTASFAIGLFWICQNFWNISRYMADARAQELPLVGGGDHDWTEIFTRWGKLEQDLQIAQRVHLIAWVGVIAIAYWLFQKVRWSRPSID